MEIPWVFNQSRSAANRTSWGSTEGPQMPVGQHMAGSNTCTGVIGGVTAAAGRLMGEIGPWAKYVVAAVFFVVGLPLLDVLPLGWSVPDSSRFRGRGLLAALGPGLIFGVALGPCTFAYMAPMLGVTFGSLARRLSMAYS